MVGDCNEVAYVVNPQTVGLETVPKVERERDERKEEENDITAVEKEE